MKLAVSSDIAQRYPGLRIAFVVAHELENGPVNAALEAELRAAEQRLLVRFADAARLESEPAITSWREIYRSFNVNPKKHRPSAEALVRRVVKGGTLPSINLATNAYLLPQLEYLLPVGGYDLARVSGDVVLRFSPGAEAFFPIGGGERENTETGEVVYADGEQVLTRRWNYKDCDAAKIVEASRDVALFVEAARPELPTEQIVALAERIAENLRKYCNARATTHLLDCARGLEATL